MNKWIAPAGVLFSLLSAQPLLAQEAVKAGEPLEIDGQAKETVWQNTRWHLLDQHITGERPDQSDFNGRYKLAWDSNYLYLLVEIVDDVLIDTHPDPKVQYWDDDCLEIFVDEDASGGEHLTNYNAFAYHIALDGQVADIGDKATDKGEVVLLNDHVESVWRRSEQAPYTITWEVAVKLYPDSFTTADPGEPVKLSEGKTIGFMLAYCDNDGSETREHFMGSHAIKPVNGDKNLGYIDASVFGKVTLVEAPSEPH